MANSFRYRSGQMQLKKYAVDSAIVIEKGDMLFLNTDDVRPASSFTWDTNLATTQAAFAAVFVGIAHESSASGSTTPIDVDTSHDSVYEMDCASDTYITGAPLGPDENSSTLHDQTLEDAAAANAIARVHTPATSATTKIRVQFAPAYMPVNVNANVG